MKKYKYLAYDAIDSDFEYFETLQEARDYLEECFLDHSEGYHPEADQCKIFRVVENVKLTVIADKKNFTDEEWEEAEYPSNFDTIAKHEFIDPN